MGHENVLPIWNLNVVDDSIEFSFQLKSNVFFISKPLSFINGASLKNLFNQAIELAFEASIC